MDVRVQRAPAGRPLRLPLPVATCSDERLAALVSGGSDRGFAEIYRRYHQPLYRYCRSILRDDRDAQDALQVAFSNAFEALRSSARDAPLRPWLYRIVHNTAISHLRQRRPEAPLSELGEVGGGSISEQVELRERVTTLLEDLRRLSDRQRGALVMRELGDLSHEEIAVALGTSVGAAKQAIFEARRALHELAEGRAMSCAEVQRMLSDEDGRSLRARTVRSHLGDCGACAAFATAIGRRRSDLRALSPLPAAAATGVLGHVLGHGSAHGGAGGVAAGATGKVTATLLTAKVMVGVAATGIAAVGVSTALTHMTSGADRTGRPAAVQGRGGSVPTAGAASATGVVRVTRRGAATDARAGHGAALGRTGRKAAHLTTSGRLMAGTHTGSGGSMTLSVNRAAGGSQSSAGAGRGLGAGHGIGAGSGNGSSAGGQGAGRAGRAHAGGGQHPTGSSTAPGGSSGAPGRSGGAGGNSGGNSGATGGAHGQPGPTPGQSGGTPAGSHTSSGSGASVSHTTSSPVVQPPKNPSSRS